MRRGHGQAGITLVELLAVVVIIGVLAAVAGSAYTKWIKKGKMAEVPQMLGQFQQREEQYRNENGVYLATGADDTDYFPKPLSGKGDITNLGTLPTEWQQLKMQPGASGLYCGYVVITGDGSTAPGDPADDLWGGTNPTKDWFYVKAECDWDNDETTNHTYYVRGDMSVTTAMQTNEGR
jgi:prepilin-type N-terminal cleavage/methylation domain-containing protein